MYADQTQVFTEVDSAANGHAAPTSPAPAHRVHASPASSHPLAFALVRRGQSVLDLGCGAGLDLVLAAERVGPEGRVVGVEPCDALIERARSTVRHSGQRHIEVRKGQIDKLPLADASVDWVIANGVIHRAGDKQQVFNEIFRVLKPGGRMLVSDTVADAMPGWLRRASALAPIRLAGAMSEGETIERLQRAGLSRCVVLGRQHHEPAQLAAMVRDALPPWLGRSAAGGLLALAARTLAGSISTRFWSARVHAMKTAVPE